MFQIPRAVRRRDLRSSGRAGRMPVLATITVAGLVALSAQGAAVASAEEMGDAASAPSSVSSSAEPQAADAQAADAIEVTRPGSAEEASAPPADSPVEAAPATEAPSDVPVDPTQATEAPGPSDASGPVPAEAVDPTQATEAPGPSDATGPEASGAGAADPAQAIEAPGASDAPGTGIPTQSADPTQATAAPSPAGPGVGELGDPVALANTPPVGVADHYTTAVDTVLTIAAPGVVGNDYDAEGDFLRTTQGYTGTTQGGHVATLWDRSVIYTPAAGFVGVDTWSYWVYDDTSMSATSVPVTFTVVDTTDVAPVAHDDSYSTPAGTSLVVSGAGVLGNDTDGDGNAVAVVSELAGAGAISSANGGTVDWMSTGGFTYIPAPGFVGYDTVTYWITDGVLESGLATVTIKVGDWANLPPVAVDDHYATPVNRVLTVDAAHGLLANDSDASDPISVVVPFMLETGRASVYLHSDGSFSYASHYYDTLGPDTFTYQVTDGSYNLPVTATVTIDVGAFANAQPIAIDDHYTTPKNTGMGVGAAAGLLANDSDPDQDAFSIEFAVPDMATEAGGIVNVGLDGSFSYTPPADFVGVDGFSYNIGDVFDGHGLAVAWITVTDPDATGNSMPVATDDHYSTTPDTTLVVSAANGMLINDFDTDGDPLSSIIPAVPYGTASVHGGTVAGTDDGGFTYTPPAGFVGEDEFVYEVMDQSAESFDVGTVRITVAAAVPLVTGEPGAGGVAGQGDPDAGASDDADVASAGTGPTAATDTSSELALTGAAPDGALALSLLLLLTGAVGIVIAAMAHRRSRRS
ncbi:Ig-like domain-containing protein [Herbiconiux sp. UC225_62]|uniref:Ig-like domain-containing protein n=1 Tax=Herbiconiux sp. UC225_62 TaxID=3350168 RepID=UPI0036D3718A